MNYKDGDLLECDETVIAHCANCFNTFGAGVAKQIKAKYPNAYAADCATKSGDKGKLGSFTKSVGDKIIYNLYGQFFYGFRNGKPPLDYSALQMAMSAMRRDLIMHHKQLYESGIAMPRIGAGLAGGDWDTIEQIINRVFFDCNVTIYTYQMHKSNK